MNVEKKISQNKVFTESKIILGEIFMTELQLCHTLEGKFKSFGYEMPFDSDMIRSKPQEAIIDGLQKLYCAGIIREEEFNAHISNFEWEEKSLQEVLEMPGAMENIEALIRNLNYWKKRYTEIYHKSNEKEK